MNRRGTGRTSRYWYLLSLGTATVALVACGSSTERPVTLRGSKERASQVSQSAVKNDGGLLPVVGAILERGGSFGDCKVENYGVGAGSDAARSYSDQYGLGTVRSGSVECGRQFVTLWEFETIAKASAATKSLFVEDQGYSYGPESRLGDAVCRPANGPSGPRGVKCVQTVAQYAVESQFVPTDTQSTSATAQEAYARYVAPVARFLSGLYVDHQEVPKVDPAVLAQAVSALCASGFEVEVPNTHGQAEPVWQIVKGVVAPFLDRFGVDPATYDQLARSGLMRYSIVDGTGAIVRDIAPLDSVPAGGDARYRGSLGCKRGER